MNTNFANIIRRIAAEQGETILADPQRLKGFINDYAKNEPADDRLAFGRCIEAGAYNELKTAPDAQRRTVVKKLLARKVNANAGIDLARCAAALDALDAALFGPAQTAPQTVQSMPQTLPPPMPGVRRISRKTALFGITAGIGALAGTFVSVFFLRNPYATSGERILDMAIWGAFTGLGISIGLFVVQIFSTKKKLDVAQLVKTVLIGITAGAVAGGFAQFIFNYTQQISDVVKNITNALCWGVMGAGLGLGAAFYVPNYPPKRAALAGLAGGTIGGTIYVLMMSAAVLGTIIGVIVLGFAIGWAISFIEEAMREAWLTVIWGRNETTTVSLGQKPVSFGPSREADVYVARRPNEQNLPPIRAVFSIENGQVVFDDRITGMKTLLPHGSQVDLGRVGVAVNIRTGK